MRLRLRQEEVAHEENEEAKKRRTEEVTVQLKRHRVEATCPVSTGAVSVNCALNKVLSTYSLRLECGDCLDSDKLLRRSPRGHSRLLLQLLLCLQVVN